MKSITRSMLVDECSNDAYTIYENASMLLKNVKKGEIRLIGTGIYHLREEEGRQLSFSDIFLRERDIISKKVEDKWRELKNYYKIDFDEIKNSSNRLKTYEYIEKMREVMESM